jgi:hypothetical protein
MATSTDPCRSASTDPKLFTDGAPQDQSDEALARLTVTLPRNLYRQFRLHALDQETTLSALMARLIREELHES